MIPFKYSSRKKTNVIHLYHSFIYTNIIVVGDNTNNGGTGKMRSIIENYDIKKAAFI